MPEITRETWLSWANSARLWGLAIAAIAGVIGLVASVAQNHFQEVVSARKDEALRVFQAESQERIATVNAQAAEANARAADARKRAAMAEQAAAEANLELARLKMPRTLNAEQQTRLIAKLAPFAGQQYSFNVFPDPESISLMRSINDVLGAARWVRMGSQLGDIVIDGAGVAHETAIQIGIVPAAKQELRQLAVLLASVLSDEGLQARADFIADLKNENAVNVNVGKKP